MCLTMCTQIVYGVIMLACLGLTLFSMFSPNWRQIKNITDVENIADLPEHIQKLPEHVGIFSFSCRMPGAEGSEEFDFNYCKDWWNNLKTWEKVVTVAMVVAAVVELFALVWDVLSALACCCKSALLTPLTLAAFCATVALAVAVGVYGYKNKEAFEGVKDLDDIKSKLDSEVGSSFWLAVAALVLALVDTVLGVIMGCLGKTCC